MQNKIHFPDPVVVVVGITQSVFLVLRLLHKIQWNWWWVFSPLLGFAAFVIIGVLFSLWIAQERPDDKIG